MVQKQHYISKILTKPWELPNSGRCVSYFDCDQNNIFQSPSKSLFSKNDLWPEEYEEVFSSKFERKLEADIKTIIFGKPKRNEETNTKAIQSILTLHHFNAMRSMRAHWNSNDIDKFVKLSSKELIKEVEMFASEHVFLALPLKPGYQYFFPESAFFRIPVYNEAYNEMDFGFAIPLHPRYAFGMFPKDFNRVEAKKISDNTLVALSIGSAFDRRIILPPTYVNNTDNTKIIESIKGSRLENIQDLQFVMDNSSRLRHRREMAIKTQ